MERQAQLSIIGRTRKSRCIIACLINWSDPVPGEPSQQVKEAIKKKGINNALLGVIKKCFNERPIWSRNALMARLNCSRPDIKFILPNVAYYFLNGPFRCMWIRFGYDPRLDKKSKIYQTLDFRVKQAYAKNMSSNRIKAKRSIYQYQLPLRKSDHEKLRPKVSTITTEALMQASTSKGGKSQEPSKESEGKLLASYVFKPGMMPAYRQLFYQLCDIQVDEVQRIVHSNDDSEPDVCDERDGWCVPKAIEQIRAVMSEAVDEMLASKQLSEAMSESGVEEDDDDEMEVDDEYLDYVA